MFDRKNLKKLTVINNDILTLLSSINGHYFKESL